MQYKYTIPTLFILSSITLTQPATGQGLSCSREIDEIGEKITVLIDNGKYTGSGTLVKKAGNLYTVLTSFHNFKRNPNLRYTIVTHDGQRYSINVRNIKPLRDGLDLTEVKFRSNRDYTIPKMGNSDDLKRRDNVYVAGFLGKTGTIEIPTYDCFDGQVSANAKRVKLESGYNLIYSNPAVPGMSGGPVLNQKGELIGIHGRGDGYKNQNIDRYAGVPINIYLQIAAGNTPQIPILPKLPQPTKLTADDYVALGLEKEDKGDNRGAILAYTDAIKINPNNSVIYKYRGTVFGELKDYQKAIADYTQAIKINPNYAHAYNNRGNAHNNLKDYQKAIADFNQAIKINPNYAHAYNNRGVVHSDLKDYQKAIADYNQAIKINPNHALAYYNRGNAHYDLKDYQKAIADYNQAIKINPNYAHAYNNRGNAKQQLGRKFSAISDFRQAAKLYQQQGKNSDYQDALNRIRKLQSR